MRNTQRSCGGRFGKHRRTGAESYENTQGAPVVPSYPGYRCGTIVPGGRMGCDPPRSKRMTRPWHRLLAIEAVSVGNAVSPIGNLDARAEPTLPSQAFSSIRSYVPCEARAKRRTLAVRFTRPKVDGVAGRSKKRTTSRGPPSRVLSNRHEGHQFVAGVPPRRAQRWGSVIQATRARGFRRAACAPPGAVNGACGFRFSTRRRRR